MENAHTAEMVSNFGIFYTEIRDSFSNFRPIYLVSRVLEVFNSYSTVRQLSSQTSTLSNVCASTLESNKLFKGATVAAANRWYDDRVERILGRLS